MTHRLRAALAVGTAAFLVGCLAPRPAEPGNPGGSGSDEGPYVPSEAIVMSSEDVRRYGGSLIDAMDSEFTSLRVAYQPRASLCPLVSLRGTIIATSHSNPLVYLDGNRMTNTCVLGDLNAGNVERVELYPSGRTPRGGYANHSSGLILVFTRGS